MLDNVYRADGELPGVLQPAHGHIRALHPAEPVLPPRQGTAAAAHSHFIIMDAGHATTLPR